MDLSRASFDEIDLYLSKKRPYKVKLVDKRSQKYYVDDEVCYSVYQAAFLFATKEFGEARKFQNDVLVWSCKRWAYFRGTIFFLNEEDALLVRMNF